MRVQRSRTDVLPLTWEIPTALVGCWCLLAMLALPAGQGLACALTGQGFVWPHGGLVESVLGLAGGRATLVDTAKRYVPWLWGALTLQIVTGTILVVGEPERDLNNRAFQWKMALIVLLTAVTIAFARSVARRAKPWDEQGGLSVLAKGATLGAFALCLTITVLGRWIAYALTE